RLANHRLHTAMRTLSRAEYDAPRTSFFPSLAKTLEHILAVDRYYLAGLDGSGDAERQWRDSPAGVPLETLAAAQAIVDQRFIDHVGALAAPALDEIVALDRGGGNVQRERRGDVIAHLLNHQVHHRGQAHAMLAGSPARPPQLDEFLLPGEAHLRADDLRALGWSEATLFA
ncbi:MAG: DinB family protein, partial [Pseudomonadota bacterium]|nr:DinB family protein [Pseudomonadota bacterium]